MRRRFASYCGSSTIAARIVQAASRSHLAIRLLARALAVAKTSWGWMDRRSGTLSKAAALGSGFGCEVIGGFRCMADLVVAEAAG